MKLIFIICTYLLLIQSQDYHGYAWQRQSASTKQSKLDSAINKDKSSAPWPSTLEKLELLFESMDTTFDTVADDMPYQGLFNWEKRPKLIHSVGVVMDSQFVAVKNNYTGVFSGCMNVLMRFSIAQEADPNGGEGALAPGIAFKFLRNTVPSANVFSMYSLVGQSSFNFFAHDLSSHVPDLPSDAPSMLKLIREKFATASSFPVFTGISDLAQFDENGNEVSKPNFPFRLQFHPNTTIHKSIPDNYTGADFADQLIKVLPKNSHLYDVYAQDTPDNDDLVLIGKLYSTQTSATRSFFGDKTMFYQHTRFENDLEFKPDWTDKAKSIMEEQQKQKMPGYHYPDLPFSV